MEFVVPVPLSLFSLPPSPFPLCEELTMLFWIDNDFAKAAVGAERVERDHCDQKETQSDCHSYFGCKHNDNSNVLICNQGFFLII